MASIGSAVVLLGLKMFLVFLTGSLGVLSEALHSFLDLLAAIITFYSVSVADKPADAQHLYGHGKGGKFFGLRGNRAFAGDLRFISFMKPGSG